MVYLIFALIGCAFSQINLELTLLIRYSDQPTEWKKAGIVKISKTDQASIVLNTEGPLLDRKRLDQNTYATLALQHRGGEQYLAHIDQQQIALFNSKAYYQELIQIVSSQGNIISFDYALKQIRKHSDSPIIIQQREVEVAPVRQMEQLQDEKFDQQTEQPPQGIFGLLLQYKWYIIIGFIVFFMLGQADPQKLNETVQQAQQQAQQATQQSGRRQKK